MDFIGRIPPKILSAICAALLSSAMAFSLYLKSEEVLICLIFAVTMFGLDIILLGIVRTGKQTAVALTFAFLNTVGTALAVLNGISIIKLFVVIVTAVGLAATAYRILPHIIRFIKQSKKRTVITLSVLAGMTFLLYIALLAFDKINGARAWYTIGGISIQATEITKLLFLCFIAVVFSSVYFGSVGKIILSIAILGLNLFFLIIYNELGTAFVMVVSWTLIQFIFTKTRHGIVILTAVILAFLLGIMVVNNLYVRFQDSGAENALVTAVNKVHSRLFPTDDYQTTMALQGIINGGFFGAGDYIVRIPVAESDYAFASLAQYFGIFTAILVIGGFIFILFCLQKNSEERLLFGFRFHLALVFIVCMIVQMTIVIFTNTKMLPVIGICAPFISSGGSQTVVSYIMVAVIASAVSTEKEVFKPFFTKRLKRKEIFNDELPDKDQTHLGRSDSCTHHRNFFSGGKSRHFRRDR